MARLCPLEMWWSSGMRASPLDGAAEVLRNEQGQFFGGGMLGFILYFVFASFAWARRKYWRLGLKREVRWVMGSVRYAEVDVDFVRTRGIRHCQMQYAETWSLGWRGGISLVQLDAGYFAAGRRAGETREGRRGGACGVIYRTRPRFSRRGTRKWNAGEPSRRPYCKPPLFPLFP